MYEVWVGNAVGACVRRACGVEATLAEVGVLADRRRGVELLLVLRIGVLAVVFLPFFLLMGSGRSPGWELRSCFNRASPRPHTTLHTVHLKVGSSPTGCFFRSWRARLFFLSLPVNDTSHCVH